VIEPGSPEMDATMAEIQDLVDQGARYEGLSETFALVSYHLVQETTDIEGGSLSLGATVQYGDTFLNSSQGSLISTDTLRRAPWTLDFRLVDRALWLAFDGYRNPFDHAPGTP